MRKSRVKAKLAKNEPVMVTAFHFNDPSVYELASLMGFDLLWLDAEHHSHNSETISGLLRAARVGTSDVVVRCAKGEFMRMGRMLEAGATGIMYPRCDGVDEAREIVRWSKFAPLGERGIDTANPDAPYGAIPIDRYIKEANEQTFVVVQIEHQRALEQVEEIAAVKGVDVIMLGPGDFGILGGFPGEFFHPKIKAAKERIAAAAKKAGIHWGCPCLNLEDMKNNMDMGARFICYSADITILRKGLEQIQAECTPLGIEFNNQLAAL